MVLGKAHAVALTSTGQLYTFGISNKGQCGRGNITGQPVKDGESVLHLHITVYVIYFASLIFCELGLQDIFASGSIRDQGGEQWTQKSVAIIHSFSEGKSSNPALHMHCTTSIAYTSRIHALGSEVNIFECC